MVLLFTFFALFIRLKSYGFVCVVIYMVLALLIFIIASNKFAQAPHLVIQTPPTLLRVYLILFFISFTLSIAYLRFFELPYSKSLWYYFVIGICATVLFIISLSVENNSFKKLLPYLTFLFILNILLSNFIVFPNGVYSSGDTHYQIYEIVLPIVENGYVPSGLAYSFFPLHQILIASLSKITGMEVVFLYMSVPSLLYAVSALFIYSAINNAGASRFGIASMLLFITAPTIFYHGTHAYQFSYALPLGILLLYIIMKLTMPIDGSNNWGLLDNRASWALMQIVAIGTIIWTHQFTSTAIFALIIIIWITNLIILKSNSDHRSFYSIVILYIVILLAHWMYVSSLFSSLVRMFDLYFSSLFTIENYQAAASNVDSTSILRSLWLIFLDTSGRGIIMMLGSMGCLYGIWKKNVYVFVWLTIGLSIWALISFGSFIKMPLLLGSRWLSFLDSMSVIFLATFGIMLLIERFGIKGMIFCSLIFFLLPVLSLGSTASGSETSLFIGDQPYIKFYDTDSDLQYRGWIKNMVPENSSILVSEHGVPKRLDNKRVYNQLPINDQDCVADDTLKLGEYLVLNKHDCLGLRVRGISEDEQVELVRTKKISTIEAQISHVRMTKLDTLEIERVATQLKSIYSNGETVICLK